MAAGDINDAASQIPGIALADDSGDPTDLGAGYALLKFKNGKLIWLPNTGSVRYALDTSSASQLAGLTEEATPADADLVLLEKASDGTKRKLQLITLLGGQSPGGYLYDAYVCVQDQKVATTGGGTFTSGAWQTRVLNTEQADTAGIASLAANRLTLPAGTYVCRIIAPAWRVDSHQARLYDTTGAAELLPGTGGFSVTGSSVTSTHSFIQGMFTLSVESALEVQHRCLTTYATYGFGVSGDFTTEVYTSAEFWRLAA